MAQGSMATDNIQDAIAAENQRVLLVEDSATQAEQLRYLLEKNGYQVTVGYNGREALELLDECRPTLVISDIVMPEMDGYEFTRKLRSRKKFKNVPVILLTNLQDPDDVIKGLEVGANNFINKPINETFLLNRIRQLLATIELRHKSRFDSVINVCFGGKDYGITVDKMQILDLLLSTYESAFLQNQELRRTRDKLKELNEHLEEIVGQRTRELKTEVVERTRAEEQLRDLYAELEHIFNCAADGMWVLDLDFEVVRINNRLCTMAGTNRDEAVGKKCYQVFPCDDCHTSNCRLQRILNGEDRIDIEAIKGGPGGVEIPTIVSAVPLKGGDERLIGVVESFKDLTEHKRLERKLIHLANYDRLTDLPNLNLLNDRLAMAIETAQRTNHQVALMVLDINHFKKINDSLGHQSGDQLLQLVAKRLVKNLFRADTIARLSGDEFVILAPEVRQAENLVALLQKVFTTLATPFVLKGTEVFITTSVGIALYPGDGTNAETLLKNADNALHWAKGDAGNAYRFFSKSMNVMAVERLSLETRLRHALRREELFLEYQPQIDLVSNRITGVEALARWRHPELGLVSPARFIPLAEETGLISEIGQWVLQTACRQARAWQDAGHAPIRMAVNLSVRQIRQPDFVSIVEQVLQETGLPAKQLELELTESAIMETPKEAVKIFQRLKNLGILLAIDDFGTGYSSLAYLKRFPIDRIKIDRSFIQDILTDPENAAIVRAVISMCRELERRVICEGVETEKQLDFLRQYQCDEIQGFFFHKPMSAKEVEELF